MKHLKFREIFFSAYFILSLLIIAGIMAVIIKPSWLMEDGLAYKVKVNSLIGAKAACFVDHPRYDKVLAVERGGNCVIKYSNSQTGLLSEHEYYGITTQRVPMIWENNNAWFCVKKGDTSLYLVKAFDSTGADANKPGYFENADTGTLFMDEISNLSSNEQSKILTVIEEKKIPVVGSGGKTKQIDVRIIAASNKDLTELSVKGEFRDDLYYRLAAGNIHIPPLRERKEDIMLLMQRFLIDNARENRMKLDIDLEAIASELKSYPWSGNVRELKNFANIVTELWESLSDQHSF